MPAIVLDTSAVIAIYLGEPTATWITAHMDGAEQLFMSTVNLAECLIILRLRDPKQADAHEQQLLTGSINFIAPDITQTKLAARARSVYPLNFGDCFAYALAKSTGLPLLTLDADFRKSDIEVLSP